MNQLNQLLEGENKDRIIQRLKILGCLNVSPLKKGQAVDTYISFVSKNVEKIFTNLDEVGKLLISEMVYGQTEAYEPLKFTAKYNKSPIFRDKGDRFNQDKSPLGALFFGSELIFPNFFKEIFKPFVSQPDNYQVGELKSLPNDSSQTERSWQAIKELQSILQAVKCKPLKVSIKTNLPSATTINILNKLFDRGDYYQGLEIEDDRIGDIRAVGWALLLQAGKLVKKVGANLEITPKGEKALKQSPEVVLKSLWDHWIKSKLLDEFKRIHNIKGQTSNAMKRGFTSVITRREMIAATLKKLPVNSWIKIEDVSRFILLNDLDFEVTRTNGWGLYISDAQYGQLGGYHSTWHILEEPYLLCLLFEYAATLGIIDIGFMSPVNRRMHHYASTWGADDLSFISRYDGLTHIKITALGEYILENISTFEMAPPPIKLTVSDDGIVSLESFLMPLDVQEILGFFGEKKSENQWKISEDTLAKALRSGHKLAKLKSLFKSYDVLLGKEMTGMLRKIEQNTGKIKLKDMLFLYECDDSLFADSIMTNKMMPYAMRAGEKLIAIPEKQKEKFQEEMLKQRVII